jgi:hypothetical protein
LRVLLEYFLKKKVSQKVGKNDFVFSKTIMQIDKEYLNKFRLENNHLRPLNNFSKHPRFVDPNIIEKYGTCVIEHVCSYNSFTLRSDFLLHAELVIYGDFDLDEITLDSSIELQVSQRVDTHYIFSQELLSRMIYGTPSKKKIINSDNQIEMTIPLYFDIFNNGNVYVPAHYHSLRINTDFKLKNRNNDSLNIFCRATYLNVNMGHNEMEMKGKYLTKTEIDIANSIDVNGFIKSQSEFNNNRRLNHIGDQIIYQLQFNGTDHLTSDDSRIRINFNHPCAGIYFAFSSYDNPDNFINDRDLLHNVYFELNGHNAVTVEKPSDILGSCSQFAQPSSKSLSDFLEITKDTSVDVSSKTKLVIFPTEVWAVIFTNLEKPKDINNLMKTCKILWKIGHKTNILAECYKKVCQNLPGWYCMPFTSTKLMDYDQNACLNFSRIDRAILSFDFNREFNGKVYILALSYNVFRTYSGMQSVIFIINGIDL